MSRQAFRALVATRLKAAGAFATAQADRLLPSRQRSGWLFVIMGVILTLTTAAAGWGHIQFAAQEMGRSLSLPSTDGHALAAPYAETEQSTLKAVMVTSLETSRQTPTIVPTAVPTCAPEKTTAAATQATTTQVKAPEKTEPVLADPAAQAPFPGIDPAVTALWQFPLKVETYTPAQGVFGARRSGSRRHAGLDLYAPDGTEVYAMTAGRVSKIYLFYESLLAIEVDNDDGTTIRYTELTPLVKAGDRVAQGQLIGRLKKNSSGSCMLHLEIYTTVGTGPLTQTGNNRYDYVTASSGSFMRRRDLVDPSAVCQLPRP